MFTMTSQTTEHTDLQELQLPTPALPDSRNDNPTAVLPHRPNDKALIHSPEHVPRSQVADDLDPNNDILSAEVAQSDNLQHPDPEQSTSSHSSIAQPESIIERIESSPTPDVTSAQAGNSAQPEKQTRNRTARWFFPRSLIEVSGFLIDTWWPEALALAFSSGCLVAIAGLLFSYHGHKIPELANGLTLNAIISTLAVGSKSALIFAVAATSISPSGVGSIHRRATAACRTCKLWTMQLGALSDRSP